MHDLPVPDQPVYGYSARSGALDYAGGIPAALPAIAAVGRQFPEVSQADAAARVCQLTGCDDSRSHAEFIADIQRDKTARDAVIAEWLRLAIQYAILLAITAVVALIGSILLARNLSDPIQRLSVAAGQIAQGQEPEIPAIDRGDEVGELARSFQRMQ